MKEEEVTAAKRSRGILKGKLTKICSGIQRLIIEEEENDSLMKEKLSDLKSEFGRLEKSHDIVTELISEEGTVEDIEKENDYIKSINSDYLQTYAAGRKYLKSPADADEKKCVEKCDNNNSGLEKMVEVLTANAVTIKTFDGTNYLEYRRFRSQFMTSFGDRDLPPATKLIKLLEFTGGRSYDSIKGCSLLPGEEAYDKAIEILDKLYNDPHTIAHELLVSLRNGPSVSSPAEISALANELSVAVDTLEGIGLKSEMDNQISMVNVIDRLPKGLQSKWADKALKYKREKKEYPKLRQLSTWVGEIAEEAACPLYSRFKYKQEAKANRVYSTFMSENDVNKDSDVCAQNDVSNFYVSHAQNVCTLCNVESHGLWQCQTFLKFTVEQRWDYVRSSRRCFKCLKPGHRVGTCKSPYKCQDCGGGHNKLLHGSGLPGNPPTVTPQPTRAAGKNNNASTVTPNTGPAVISDPSVKRADDPRKNYMAEGNSSVVLPIVSISLDNNESIFALCDNCSTNTWLDADVAERIGSATGSKDIDVVTLTSPSATKLKSKILCVNAKSVYGESLRLENVLTVKLNSMHPYQNVDLDKYSYLKDVPLDRSVSEVKVQMIIGMDNAELIKTLEVVEGSGGKGPIACRTPLGWTIGGPIEDNPGNIVSKLARVKSTAYHVSLNAFEVDGKTSDLSPEQPGLSQDDRRTLDLWDRTCKIVNGKYMLPIPWRETTDFPDNYGYVHGRFQSLVRKLNRSGDEAWDEYDRTIKKNYDKGYSELVPEDELDKRGGKVNFLAHHGSRTESKPKLRVVYDCLAEHKGASINKLALQGPDFMNDLLGVLLRFRQYQTAFMADIEGMYHQVQVSEEDKDALRYLYFNDNGELVQYRMKVHLFGGVWSGAAAIYCLRRIAKDFDVPAYVEENLNKAFYVDDNLASVKSHGIEYKAIDVIEDTREATGKCGMNLRAIVCNDPQVMEKVSPELRAEEAKEISDHINAKALGLRWDVVNDTFYFQNTCGRPDDETNKSGVTKRILFSRVGKLFDRPGFISPIIVKGRMLFQEATRRGVGWDQLLPQDLADKYRAWLGGLEGIESLRFPRCIMPEEYEDGVVDLHHFSDSSEKCYGAVSYARIITRQGKIKVTLLMSKGRLAPMKQVSLPRLELCGAVSAVELDWRLRHELDLEITSSTFWTDSTIVLSYLRNTHKRFKAYVANRVGTILSNSSVDQWKHIKGVCNPADIVSRGCDVADLPEQWISGPKFLSEYKSTWEVECEEELAHDLNLDPEVKKEVECFATTLNDEKSEDESNDKPPLDKLLNHYSSFYKAKKALAWWVRAKNHLKDVIKGEKSKPKKGDPKPQEVSNVTVSEMNNAEMIFVKHVQSQFYSNEIRDLLSKSKEVKKSSPIIKLSPELRDDIIVVGGRLNFSLFSYSLKHPAIIPHKSRLAELIAADYHGGHVGVEWMINAIRNKFWITKIRPLVKGVKKKCVVCKRLYAGTMSQIMADLPPSRTLTGYPPFTHTGVDLFGPISVRQGRSDVKRYGCVFTCFNTRAIHIEKLASLETDTFINGLVRFISRRGSPILIKSDQGTNLVGASNELRAVLREIDHAKVAQNLRAKSIDWEFNTPKASNFGGLWERQIRTIKRLLAALLTGPGVGRGLSDDVLETVFCQVESIINSRPITKLSSDVNDDAALTPNHLLLLRESAIPPWGEFSVADTYRRNWKYAQSIINQFWKRWVKGYLVDLQSRSKWNLTERDLKQGDLVLVTDQDSPRSSWPLALVTDVKMSQDGHVRSVTVKTKTSTLVRPVTKLVLLEESE